MKRLEVSGAVRPIYGSLGVKRLTGIKITIVECFFCCCTGESICSEALLVCFVENTNRGTYKVASENYDGGYVLFMVHDDEGEKAEQPK